MQPIRREISETSHHDEMGHDQVPAVGDSLETRRSGQISSGDVPLRERAFGAVDEAAGVRWWVMFEGVAPGIGKTTVATALAHQLESRGWTVDFFDERALFDRAETSAAAASFRTLRTATEEGLLDGYRKLTYRDPEADAIVFPWSCPALAEDLDWAAEQTILTRHARTVAEIVRARFEPVLVWLDGPVDLAFHRAAASRGDRWLEQEARHAPTDDGDLQSLAIAGHAARARAAAPRLRTAAVDGGWTVCDVDATKPSAEVVAAVIARLTLCG